MANNRQLAANLTNFSVIEEAVKERDRVFKAVSELDCAEHPGHKIIGFVDGRPPVCSMCLEKTDVGV